MKTKNGILETVRKGGSEKQASQKKQPSRKKPAAKSFKKDTGAQGGPKSSFRKVKDRVKVSYEGQLAHSRGSSKRKMVSYGAPNRDQHTVRSSGQTGGMVGNGVLRDNNKLSKGGVRSRSQLEMGNGNLRDA